MKNIVIQLLLVSCVIYLGVPKLHSQQKDNINLPYIECDENLPLNRNLNSRTVNIFVNKEWTIYIRDKKLVYWDEVASILASIGRDSIIEKTALSSVTIYADESIKYRFLDKLKSEIARTGIKYFLFKLNEESSSDFEAELVHGTIEPKWVDRVIRTKEYEFDSVNLIKTNIPAWLKVKDSGKFDEEIHYNFRKFLYSGEIDKVEQFLAKNQNASIILLPGKKFKIKNHVFSLENVKSFVQLTIEQKIIFVRFDNDLDYDDYIHYLNFKRKVFNSKDKSANSKSAKFVEVSFGLEKKLKEWELDIF